MKTRIHTLAFLLTLVVSGKLNANPEKIVTEQITSDDASALDIFDLPHSIEKGGYKYSFSEISEKEYEENASNFKKKTSLNGLDEIALAETNLLGNIIDNITRKRDYYEVNCSSGDSIILYEDLKEVSTPQFDDTDFTEIYLYNPGLQSNFMTFYAKKFEGRDYFLINRKTCQKFQLEDYTIISPNGKLSVSAIDKKIGDNSYAIKLYMNETGMPQKAITIELENGGPRAPVWIDDNTVQFHCSWRKEYYYFEMKIEK